MPRFRRALLISSGIMLTLLTAAMTFGGPGTPHPMGSVTDPFLSVDFSDLPKVSTFTARDGTPLAYRYYAPAPTTAALGSVVLIHGSSATSSSMHVMAKAMRDAGFATYALDVRGHGASGQK